MTNKSKARYGIRRGPKKFALHPTTRAIRHAFAFGLALVASGRSFAGTCDVSNPAQATCDGTFAGSNISYAIDDLTLVVGGDLPTDIQPLDGFSGIDLYAANGTIDLTSAADIRTTNAAAISVNAPNGDVSVANSGDLHATYADGIDASSYSGNVTVHNAGSVTAMGSHGIEARSGNGDVTVDNAAGSSVIVTNAYGNATGIEAQTYYGDIAVTNEGVVDASVVSYGNATGINASGFTGDVSVANGITGTVSAITDNVYGGKAIGVRAGSYLGASSVSNAGDIGANATGVYGNVTSYGVRNRGGYYGSTSTVNDGAISSSASTGDGVGWAWGISNRGQYASISNSGQVSADAYAGNGYASGTASYSRGGYSGTSSTSNTGDITARAVVGNAGTARAYGAMIWGGDAAVDNQGSITGYARTQDGTAAAMGTSSHYNRSITANNDGNIVADVAAGLGFAASFASYDYALDLSTVTNGDTGSLRAIAEVGNGYAFAYGAWLDSGDASTLANLGSISANASVDAGTADFGTKGAMARTIGANVMARYGDAYLTNAASGTIDAYSGAHGETGRTYAFGAVVHGSDTAKVVNNGTISAVAYATAGSAVTLGDMAYSGGFAVNLNYGSISAASTVYGDGYARAIGQYAFGEVSTVVNEGSVSASSTVGSGAAVADGAKAYGNFTATYNDGDITASASAGNGDTSAYGVYSFGVSGSSVDNYGTGTIAASAATGNGTAVALGVYNIANIYGAYATNDGSISATASASGSGVAGAMGIENIAVHYGDAVTINHGDISANASAASGTALAKGIYNLAYVYDASVTNTGNVSATASNAYGYAIATGVDTISHYYGNATVANDGQISALAHADLGVAQAMGVHASAYFNGTIDNDGSVLASADAGSGYAKATGIFDYVVHGDAVLNNQGDISVSATAHGDFSYAVARGAYLGGNAFTHNTATLSNNGSIGVTAMVDGIGFASATGTTLNAKYATETNQGSISAAASAGYGGVAKSTGSYSAGKYASSTTNHGSISAVSSSDKGYAAAHGLTDSSYYRGTTTTVNYGDISASAHTAGHSDTGYGGYAYAFGTTALARYDAIVHNAGSISAEADAAFGVARAVAVSMDSSHGTTYGSMLTNDGTIYARASGSDYYAQAIGSDLEGRFIATTVNNAGSSIVAIATADRGLAEAYGSGTSTWGVDAIDTRLTNHGDIGATAIAADGTALATAASVRGTFVAYTSNDGSILAQAQAVGGTAVATANRTFSFYGNGTLANANAIGAHADAGTDGSAFAYGSAIVGGYDSNTAIGGTGSTVNAAGGAIGAYAVAGGDHAGQALAIGSITAGSYASLVNHGDIGATAITSGYSQASATGAAVTGDFATYGRAFRYFYGTVHNVGTTVSNDGAIGATAQAGAGIATATGVNAISSGGDVTVTNAGDIIATASGASGSTAIGVSMTSNGVNTLTNTGNIVAAGDGSTHVAVRSSDLAAATIDNQGNLRGSILTGSLDDILVNHAGATIVLDNDTIDLGTSAALGNTFRNDGTLVVRGDGNTIAMGALNPNAFSNTGSITFLDGTPHDALTLAGDLSGSGRIGVDVSTLHNTSDMLHVAGNVDAGSVTTVDLNLLDVPTTQFSTVAVADVTGDSSAGSFVLGDVHFDQGRSLLDVAAVSLTSDIDASNARPDVFSASLAVTGLTDAGSLATAFAPGVQSLMNSEVGTWRQRMGAIGKPTAGGVSGWARVFQDSGTVDQTHVANNFGQGGNFSFDQTNSGQELGVDVGVSDAFSAGLMLGKAQASQHLDAAGAGRNRITGDTRGVYGTWLGSSGFYLDASYRWMSFDARLDSATGESRATGDARAFNMELGRSWTFGGGLAIAPQAQYTRTTVDHVDSLSGALNGFKAAAADSSRGRIGLLLSKDFAAGNAVWTPYGSINAVREFDGKNAFTIDGVFSGATSTRGTNALVEGGLTVRSGKLSMFGGVNWQDGGALQGFVGGQLGLRYSW